MIFNNCFHICLPTSWVFTLSKWVNISKGYLDTLTSLLMEFSINIRHPKSWNKKRQGRINPAFRRYLSENKLSLIFFCLLAAPVQNVCVLSSLSFQKLPPAERLPSPMAIWCRAKRSGSEQCERSTLYGGRAGQGSAYHRWRGVRTYRIAMVIHE